MGIVKEKESKGKENEWKKEKQIEMKRVQRVQRTDKEKRKNNVRDGAIRATQERPKAMATP